MPIKIYSFLVYQETIDVHFLWWHNNLLKFRWTTERDRMKAREHDYILCTLGSLRFLFSSFARHEKEERVRDHFANF